MDRFQDRLPDLNKLSILVATILLAYSLAQFVSIPAQVVEFSILGILFPIHLNFSTLVSLLVAGLTASGTAWMLESHPASKSYGSTAVHWLLPSLTSLVLFQAIDQLPSNLVVGRRCQWISPDPGFSFRIYRVGQHQPIIHAGRNGYYCNCYRIILNSVNFPSRRRDKTVLSDPVIKFCSSAGLSTRDPFTAKWLLGICTGFCFFSVDRRNCCRIALFASRLNWFWNCFNRTIICINRNQRPATTRRINNRQKRVNLAPGDYLTLLDQCNLYLNRFLFQ